MAGLLALLAHPDDEVFCAGLLAAARAKAVPVHLAYWTRGEGGGSPRARYFWSRLPRDWHPRMREARRAGAVLGATVEFLGAIDPPGNPGLQAPAMESAAVETRLAALVEEHRPELVVTHGSSGEYGHPAHRRLHEIACDFFAARRDVPLVTFAAALPGATTAGFLNADDPADFVLDSQPYLEIKRNIVCAHRSQVGVLATLPDAGGTLESLLQRTRYEGYRCRSGKEAALALLSRWQ